MTYTASDVPNRIDVLIDGQGYRFLETDEVKGISSFAPTFLQRTNVSDAYGDEDQDWWLTMSQNDWSLGDGQRFLTAADPESKRRYWSGSTIDGTEPGVLRLSDGWIVNTDLANAAVACCDMNPAVSLSQVYVASSARLYRVSDAGTITDDGVHGLGAAPSTFGMATDGTNVYLGTSTAGTVGVRRFTGAAFSTYSATAADSLAWLNNALYGYNQTTGALVRFTPGAEPVAATTIFTWQTGTTAAQAARTKLLPYGGDLMILRGSGPVTATTGQPASLWVYDGVAPAKVADFPLDFDPWDMTVLNGAVFVIGIARGRARGTSSGYPAVYVYTNGQLTLLWVSPTTGNTSYGGIASFAGAVFFSASGGYVYRYTPETGAIDNVSVIVSAGYQRIVASSYSLHAFRLGTVFNYVYPATTKVSSGYVQTSLFTGDTSRTKRFKSVVVEFDAGSGGNGGSVDVSYRLNDVDGSYTSIQTGITSGTEYAIGQNGRAISIQVTLNRGTSTTPPQLKRIYVRAAPLLDTFRKERYVLDLTGVDGEQHLQMRDGITVHPKDGLQMATDLRTAIASTTPVTIVDEFGSYSAYLVPEECEIRRVRSQEYTAVITARQV